MITSRSQVVSPSFYTQIGQRHSLSSPPLLSTFTSNAERAQFVSPRPASDIRSEDPHRRRAFGSPFQSEERTAHTTKQSLMSHAAQVPQSSPERPTFDDHRNGTNDYRNGNAEHRATLKQMESGTTHTTNDDSQRQIVSATAYARGDNVPPGQKFPNPLSELRHWGKEYFAEFLVRPAPL